MSGVEEFHMAWGHRIALVLGIWVIIIGTQLSPMKMIGRCLYVVRCIDASRSSEFAFPILRICHFSLLLKSLTRLIYRERKVDVTSHIKFKQEYVVYWHRFRGHYPPHDRRQQNNHVIITVQTSWWLSPQILGHRILHQKYPGPPFTMMPTFVDLMREFPYDVVWIVVLIGTLNERWQEEVKFEAHAGWVWVIW